MKIIMSGCNIIIIIIIIVTFTPCGNFKQDILLLL